MENEDQTKSNNLLKKTVISLIVIVLLESWAIYKLLNTKIEDNVFLPRFFFGELDSRYEDNYFGAKGTWISDTKLAYSAQTTQLECYKEFGYCFNTTAYLSDDDFLGVDTALYKIDSWTVERITTKPQLAALGCTETTLNIDRIAKKATLMRVTKDNTSRACKGIQDTPVISQLGEKSL